TLFLPSFYEVPVQVVLKEREPEINVHDRCRDVEEQGRETIIQEALERDMMRRFQLETDPLIRLTIVQTGKNEYQFIWSHHHIIMDGWCMGILVNEFKKLYNAFRQGIRSSLEPAIPYVRYIEWLKQNNHAHSGEFWKNYLAGYDQLAVLPGRTAQAGSASQPAIFTRTIGAAPAAALQHCCSEWGITLNVLLSGVWALLLAKYNYTTDVVFGQVVSGRPAEIEGVEQMVGLFINTIPVRVHTDVDAALGTYFKKIQAGALATEPHQYLPLTEIQSVSETGRAVFDHILVFENLPVQADSEHEETHRAAGGFTVSDIRASEFTSYNLALLLVPGSEITIRALYNAAVYDAAVMEQITGHFCNLLYALVANPAAQLADLDMLTAEERDRVVNRFNQTETPYPANKTIIQLFHEQAARTPFQLACVFNDTRFSFIQLQEHANRFARYLQQSAGVQKGGHVVLMLEREAWLMPALFGILTAGAVYIPIDPHFPADRINSILNDVRPAAIITRTSLVHRWLNEQHIPVIDLDIVLNNIMAVSCAPHTIPYSGTDLAYILYTSGSTGKPKGVMIRHHSVLNRILWQQKICPIGTTDRLLQKTPLVFDVSVWELFWFAFTGATLYLLPPGDEKDPSRLQEFVHQEKITVLHFVPSMLAHYLELPRAADQPGNLHTVFASGEALKPEHVRSFAEKFHRQHATRLINLYGPTEAAVDVTWYECLFNEHITNVPIGRPIDNTQVFITDPFGLPVPAGVPGELSIGGVALAAGYFNNETQTQARFRPASFGARQRLYFTGDLARWQQKGLIDFLGRLDHQVKINGLRIELGDLEYHITRFPGISEALVLARTLAAGAAPVLVAYYVAEKELTGIREHMLQTVPEYMVPSFFIHLHRIPVTGNGKADRKALPNPVENSPAQKQLPRTLEEVVLAQVWTAVLGKQEPGITDNFFGLGGDSIKSIQISARLHNQGYELPVREILSFPTIQEQAARLKKINGRQFTGIIKGRLKTTPIQNWFLNGPVQHKHHFNQSVLLRVPRGTDAAVWQHVFRQLVA
ncbi:MAG: amino acid adenylation domain-containing protein, partial [Dinghuibacter sp.]|nr:amino acid adenylation domain-containing protein [Dinghuibacter sp.]